MNLKKTLFTVTALGVLTISAHAQMAGAPTPPTPMIPGMVPGTTPGFVTSANNAMPMPNDMPANSMQSGMMQTPTTMPPGTMPVAPPMPMGQMMPGMMSAQDQVFAARAAEGNLAEILFAQLAQTKTTNPNVRQTAQIIEAGHTKAQNDMMQMMRARNIRVQPMLSGPHMAVYDALKRARGDDFDKMYLAGQTVDHENTIALFDAQTRAGMDDALKGYAGRYLPDIVGHTILIYNVAKQVKAPGSELRPSLPPVPPGVTPAFMGAPIDMTNTNTIVMSMNQMMMRMNGSR